MQSPRICWRKSPSFRFGGKVQKPYATVQNFRLAELGFESIANGCDPQI